MVMTFKGTEDSYFTWVEEHATGFVLEVDRNGTSRHNVLHRATCSYIKYRRQPDADARPPANGRSMVVSAKAQALRDWVKEEPTSCALCKPLPGGGRVPNAHDGAGTFLLAWNPSNWPWNYIKDSIEEIASHGTFSDTWSLGNTRKPTVGSRVFLIRVGPDPRGLVGSGWVSRAPFTAEHWSELRANRGETSSYVQVDFDVLAEEPFIWRTELDSPPFDRMKKWSPQSSGIEIKPPIAAELEELWQARTHASGVFPDDVGTDPSISEGAVQQILVNKYERDPRLRQRCIVYHGSTCKVCERDMAELYGPDARSCIHVHHLTPLSEVGSAHEVNPTTDLVPVCPNCHAVIHLKDPPYDVEQARALIRERQAESSA